VLIPVNTWIAQMQQKLNKAIMKIKVSSVQLTTTLVQLTTDFLVQEIMKIKDERSNVMDEILQGI
jgi:hypothetical protein